MKQRCFGVVLVVLLGVLFVPAPALVVAQESTSEFYPGLEVYVSRRGFYNPHCTGSEGERWFKENPVSYAGNCQYPSFEWIPTDFTGIVRSHWQLGFYHNGMVRVCTKGSLFNTQCGWYYPYTVVPVGIKLPSRIKSPATSKSSLTSGECGRNGDLYFVCSGDTLGSIAQKFGIKLENLIKWNGIINPDRILVGQALIIRR